MNISPLIPEYCYPMLASRSPQSLFSEDSISNWIKQKKLPKEKGMVLVHPKIIQDIYFFSQKNNFSPTQTTEISLAIRDIGLGNLSEQDLDIHLRKIFPSLILKDLFLIKDFILHLFQEELPSLEDFSPLEMKASSPEVSSEKKDSVITKSLSLIPALSRFPRLGQQKITSLDITLHGNFEPARPSVKNWITLYQQEMGPAPHESFERSEFLFHNPNVLKLSKEEGDKLNTLLTSLDENLLLSIDPLRQEILWNTSANPLRKLPSKNNTPSNISDPKKEIREESVQKSISPTPPPTKELPPQVKKQSHLQQEISSPQKQESSLPNPNTLPKDFFQQPPSQQTTRVKNIQFSSGHTFPQEKTTTPDIPEDPRFS